MTDLTEYGDVMINTVMDEWGFRKIDGLLEDGTTIISIGAIIKSWTASLNVTHTFTRPFRFMKLTQTANLTHTFLRHRFMKLTQTLQALHTWTVTKPGLILKQWATSLQLTHTFERPIRFMKLTQTLNTTHVFLRHRFMKLSQILNLTHIFQRPYRKIGYAQTLQPTHVFSRPVRLIRFPATLQLTHLLSRPSRLIRWLQSLGLLHEYYVIKPGVGPMKIMLLLSNIGINPKTGEIVFVL